MSARNRGGHMPNSKKKMERDHKQNSLTKNRVVDLKAFRRRKNGKIKKVSLFGYRSILFGLVVILLSLSILCGIFSLFALPWRAKFVIWAAFFATIGLVGGLALSVASDRRAQKLMGLLSMSLLLAMIAAIVKTGF